MFTKFLLWVTVCLLFGCAGVVPGPDSVSGRVASSESQVSARAETRWQAMAAKDLDQAYEFLSPGSKAANPLELFKSKTRLLDWRPAKVRSASCEADKCSVKLEITFFDRRLGELTTVYEETWIKDAGNWWYVFNG
jgi:hypothetical protein